MGAEFIFDNPSKELHFVIDDRNVVIWETLPAGEKGSTFAFQTRQMAENFAIGYARRLGFVRRLAEQTEPQELTV